MTCQNAQGHVAAPREDSLVVSMQNGICTDALAAIVGKERTVGCVIGWVPPCMDRGSWR